MRGIRKLIIFSRKVSFARGSLLDLSAPSLTQKFSNLPAGSNGEDGKNGANGPTGKTEIFILVNKNAMRAIKLSK